MGRHDAPVVLLQANPHFAAEDEQTWADPKVSDQALASAMAPLGTSFLWLRDGLDWAAGARWWLPRLKALRGMPASADLADRLLVIEFHGYHSPSWQALPITLPSQPYSFYLVDQAMGRRAVIVVMRAWREWQVAVPSLRHYDRLLRASNPENSHITRASLGPEESWGLIHKVLSGQP